MSRIEGGSSTLAYYGPVITVLIREMILADIPAGLGLSGASGWNQTEQDWRYFLTAAPHGALAAEENGRVVGTVATLPYGPFAWISMVLVDPAARRKGIGTLLLNRGLALIPEPIVPRLDATPAGEVLYRKLGFVGEYRISRWFLERKGTFGLEPEATEIVRPLTAVDWPAMCEMDARAFGASRADLLKRLADDAPEYAWVVEREGNLQGYLLGRHGRLREHLGPLIAGTPDVAQQLLDTCLAAHPGRAIFLDAPDDQSAWSATLAERGFAIERSLLRMYRGQLLTPGEPSQIFAITGPEFG
jgi:GNAT superfamily N-acetyltransferase